MFTARYRVQTDYMEIFAPDTHQVFTRAASQWDQCSQEVIEIWV